MSIATTPVTDRPVRDFLSAGFPRPAHVPVIAHTEGAPPLADVRQPAPSPVLVSLFVGLAVAGYPKGAPVYPGDERTLYELQAYWEGERREAGGLGAYDEACWRLHQLRHVAADRRAAGNAARRVGP